MSRVIAFFVFMALGLVLWANTLTAQGPERIEWEEDLAAATAKAAEVGRPLMVVFR